MTTGEQIKAARKQAEMTQAELAQKLGISYVGVSQWENDLRKPKPDTLQRIAEALRTPVEQILGEPSWISGNLRFYRKIDGVSRNKLSEETGIEVSDIRAYEDPSSGRFITEEHLEKIANYFHVPKDQIKGYSVTQEWMLETMEQNKRLQDYGDGFHAEPGLKQSTVDGVKARIAELKEEDRNRRRVNNAYDRLNPEGQQEAAKRMEELTEIPRYCAEPLTAAPLAPPECKDTTASEPPPEPPKSGG